MFKKIDIEHFSVFKNFVWNSSVKDTNNQPQYFQDINIIYGRNYSGKTSLSRIVRSIETGNLPDKCDNPKFNMELYSGPPITPTTLASSSICIRVFSEDFVRDHLRFLVDPDGNGEIKPIAILGDNNAKIEEAIRNLSLELGESEAGEESGLYAELKTASAVAKNAKNNFSDKTNQLKAQLTNKATGKEIGIKYKFEKFGDQNYNITTLKNDINMILDMQYQKPNKTALDEFETLIKENNKPHVSFAPHSISLEDIHITANELTIKKIGNSDKINELLLDGELNEWVRQGRQLHESKRETCAMCGAEISEDRWNIIKSHFDEETTLLETSIGSLCLKIDNEKKAIGDWLTKYEKLDLYSSFQQERQKYADKLSQLFTDYFKTLDEVSEKLKKRKSNIIQSFTVLSPGSEFNDSITEIKEIIMAAVELIAESNKFTADLSEKQEEAKKSLRLNEVYEFCVEIGYESCCQEKENLSKELDDLRAAEDVIKRNIENKKMLIENQKKGLNDEGKGAELVNGYLSHYFGHQFLRLMPRTDISSNEQKVSFEIWRGAERAYNLSAGERNIIAFCYFLAKLEDTSTKGNKPIIWIDDPASSLDSSHVFFIYSIIASNIVKANIYEQLFITTHCLNFLKYLLRLNGFTPKKSINDKQQNKELRYLLIHRDDSQSKIILMPKYMREYVTEFNYLFYEIFTCAKSNQVDDSNYTSFYSFGNSARKFLELYLYYKYPDHNMKPQARLEKFFGSADNIPVILVDRLDNELSHLAGTFERAGLPNDQAEIQKVAKLILEKIEDFDSEQYGALVASICDMPIILN